MAFYAYYDVWEEVNRLVKDGGAIGSLYIDDLTISGLKVPNRLMWKIKKVIHRSGLRYHKEKVFIDRPAEITSVILQGARLLPPNRQLLKRHRVQRAVIVASDKERALLLKQLDGLIGQASQISSINSLRQNSAD